MSMSRFCYILAAIDELGYLEIIRVAANMVKNSTFK